MCPSYVPQLSTAVMDRQSTTDESAHLSEKISVNDAFKEAFRWHPGGVALVTADAGDGPAALTATSVTSVSMHPPVLMFSVSRHSSSKATLDLTKSIVIHFLSADDIELAKLGATSGIDRFADTDVWTRLPTGEPVFTQVAIWLKADVLKRTDVAGSTIMICQVTEHPLEAGVVRSSGGSLAYVDRAWHRLDDNSEYFS